MTASSCHQGHLGGFSRATPNHSDRAGRSPPLFYKYFTALYLCKVPTEAPVLIKESIVVTLSAFFASFLIFFLFWRLWNQLLDSNRFMVSSYTVINFQWSSRNQWILWLEGALYFVVLYWKDLLDFLDYGSLQHLRKSTVYIILYIIMLYIYFSFPVYYY